MNKSTEFNSTKTAISTQKESYSAQLVAEYEPVEHSVLDYGCGKLRNSRYLQDKGFKVSVLDLPEMLNKIDTSNFNVVSSVEKNKFDVVLCSFVLNTVLKETRMEILKNIRHTLKPGGYAYVEVRTRITPKPKHTFPYKDGYLHGKNSIKTFQRTFTEKDFRSLLSEAGFKVLAIFDNGRGITAKIYKWGR